MRLLTSAPATVSISVSEASKHPKILLKPKSRLLRYTDSRVALVLPVSWSPQFHLDLSRARSVRRRLPAGFSHASTHAHIDRRFGTSGLSPPSRPALTSSSEHSGLYRSISSSS